MTPHNVFLTRRVYVARPQDEQPTDGPRLLFLNGDTVVSLDGRRFILISQSNTP